MSSENSSSGGNVVPMTVKWGKETLELKMPLGTLSYKSLTNELEERTGVPTDRMKLMAKSKGLWKGVLKESTWSSVDWPKAIAASGGKGINLLLMGSATKLAQPKTKTVFLEDLPEEEIAKVHEPSGLVNLGNTCYMNSVVQCLRAIPSLRSGLVQQQALPPAEQMGTDSGNTGTAGAGGGPDLSAFTNQPIGTAGLQNRQASLMLCSALTQTLQRLDRQTDALRPIPLLQAMQMNFPQFAEMGSSGGAIPQQVPKQQDAEEFYSCLLTALSEHTKHPRVIESGLQSSKSSAGDGDSSAAEGHTSNSQLDGATNLIDAIFGMKLRSTLTCDEVPDSGSEPPVVTHELHRKLTCNIRASEQGAAPTSSADAAAAANGNVTNIYDGLAVGLKSSIEKHSAVLGRNATWTSTQRLERLPSVLTVQFGRFFWKETPDSQDHAGVKCKVLKSVAFGSTLDVYDFCTPEVQETLLKARRMAHAEEEDRINKKLRGQIDEDAKMDDAGETKKEGKEMTSLDNSKKKEGDEEEQPMETEDEEAVALKAALAMSMEEELPVVGPGLPRNFQGHYELFAVVTHKGRDADGGHYMSWVKADHSPNRVEKIADTNEDNEDWYVFDDDEVSPCKTEDVLKLKGGGDWHMSYLNFYRPKK